MNKTFDVLYEYMGGKPITNTHSHYMRDEDFEDFDLDKLLENTYVKWCGVDWNKTYEGRSNLIKKVRFNSYFSWFQKGLQEVHDIKSPLSPDNWESISDRIKHNYRNKTFHIDVAQNKCRYVTINEDAYWDPGSDNGHPELFTPIFRINSFLFGYSPHVVDHDGNNPLHLYNIRTKDIDEYISFIRNMIHTKKNQGCVALKCPVAYDRSIDFKEVTKDRARQAFAFDDNKASEADITAFQDYVIFQICRIAAELDLPIQFHTGMGKITRSNALWMREIIEKSPDTKFVLLHCSSPWIDDISALVRYFPNVYPDLSMLALNSSTACISMIHQLIEGSTSEKVCWGCDTWTPEESFGSLLAIKHALAAALAEKVDRGYFSLSDAEIVLDNILYNNGHELYKLG